MTFHSLEQRRRIQPYRATPQEIANRLKLAKRDLAAARKTLHADHDWAFSMAYNAVLQAARALVLAKGYRLRGAEQHGTAVEFCRLSLGKQAEADIDRFDQMRRKRHRVIYDEAGLVSQREAEETISFAEQLVERLRELITNQPGLNLRI